MNWKQTILTPEKFINLRPDMEIHQTQTIQSSINQAASILNSETNGLIQKVWEYNTAYNNDALSDFDIQFSQRDPNNDLFREEWQLEQLVEAICVQTQFMINNGNDLSGGNSSFSMGGISGSWNKPTNRDMLAPSVVKLLSNAGVYVLQKFTKDSEKCCDSECSDKYETEALTRSLGDKRYVKKYQETAQEGDIAVIDNSKQVVFRHPTNIQFSSFNSDKIKDWQENTYKTIDKITDIIFRGNDLYGAHSAMTRGEVYNIVAQSLLVWQPNFDYKKDQVIDFVDKSNENKWVLYKFIALRDNVGKDPFTSLEDWKQIGVGVNVDINSIVNLVYERIEAKVSGDFSNLRNELTQAIEDNFQEVQDKFSELEQHNNEVLENITLENKERIKQEVSKQLSELPTIDNILFKKGEVSLFKDKQEFINLINDLVNKNKLAKSLELNVDYEEYQEGKLLKFSNDLTATNAGSNTYLLKRSDLPNDKEWTTLPVSIVDGGWNSNLLIYGTQSNGFHWKSVGVMDSGFNADSTDTGFNLWKNIELEFRLNGNVPQTSIEFNPEHITIYGVKWLKDIIVKSVVNVEGGSTDTSNLAKLSEQNTFEALNIFNNAVRFLGATRFNYAPDFLNGIRLRSEDTRAPLTLKLQNNELVVDFNSVLTSNSDNALITNSMLVNYGRAILQAMEGKDLELERGISSLSEKVTTNEREIDSNQSLINDLTTKHNQLVNEVTQHNETLKTVETKASQNSISIENINRSIEAINQAQSNDISFIGEIQRDRTYKLNDMGFVGDNWYVAINDNVSGEINANWKKISAPQAQVDLSGYYNKVETNQLLQPLETRLVEIEAKNTQQDSELASKVSQEQLRENNTNFYNKGQIDEGWVSNAKFGEYFTKDSSNRLQITNDLDCNNRYVFNVVDPNSPQDAANKRYVDNSITERTMAITRFGWNGTNVEGNDFLKVDSLADMSQHPNGYYQSLTYRNYFPDLPRGESGSGMLLNISYMGSTTRGYQQWLPRENSGKIYARHKMDNGWQPWIVFEGRVL